MAGLLDFENLFNPSNDFVRRRVGWLIEVNHTVVFENINGSLGGRVTASKRGEMVSFHIEFVEVLNNKKGEAYSNDEM